ncbi:hypothetical protein C8F04DRAFT_1193035 [Mycena alexandri]|uniref:Uncharacterized protein n=1 Tax=Mycena alexandri TaxID=1745969 RepID=A0AAD6SEC7_9AGAR|nr:hypothetical protein C8F04DRAFT_1193035 [Mycena alexandri]
MQYTGPVEYTVLRHNPATLDELTSLWVRTWRGEGKGVKMRRGGEDGMGWDTGHVYTGSPRKLRATPACPHIAAGQEPRAVLSTVSTRAEAPITHGNGNRKVKVGSA